MGYFNTARNIELSVIQSLEANIASDWSGITVVKSFKNAYSADIPVVAIYEQDVTMTRQEIGDTTHRKVFGIVIDVFASSSGQRIDLSDYISNKVILGFVYNTYSHPSGDNSQIIATPDGRITFRGFIENRKVEIVGSPDFHDRFRHLISFTVERF